MQNFVQNMELIKKKRLNKAKQKLDLYSIERWIKNLSFFMLENYIKLDRMRIMIFYICICNLLCPIIKTKLFF